jgi:hypothetical protein
VGGVGWGWGAGNNRVLRGIWMLDSVVVVVRDWRVDAGGIGWDGIG